MNNILQLLDVVSEHVWNNDDIINTNPSETVSTRSTSAQSQINWTECVKKTWPLDDIKKAGTNDPFDIRTNNKYIFEVKECESPGKFQLNNTPCCKYGNNQVIYYLNTLRHKSGFYHSIIGGEYWSGLSDSVEELKENDRKDYLARKEQIRVNYGNKHSDDRPKHAKPSRELYVDMIYKDFGIDYTPQFLCVTDEYINYLNNYKIHTSDITINNLITRTSIIKRFFLYTTCKIKHDNISIFRPPPETYKAFGENKTLKEWSDDNRYPHNYKTLYNKISKEYYKNGSVSFEEILMLKKGGRVKITPKNGYYQKKLFE